MIKAGIQRVHVEKDAGALANFSVRPGVDWWVEEGAPVPTHPQDTHSHTFASQDEEYVKAGATIVTAKEAFAQDVVLKVRPPDISSEVQLFKDGSRLVSFIYPAQNKDLVAKLQEKKLTVFGKGIMGLAHETQYCMCR